MAADVRSLRVFIACIFFSICHAFYIPGWSIQTFREGKLIPLFHNKIFSDSTELYYAYSELPFVCQPSGRKHPSARITSGTSLTLNLGEVLRGDRITISDYELIMGEDQEVQFLCNHKVDRNGVRWAQQLIRDRYMVEWIVDNLPGATSYVTTDRSRKYYAAGFRLGYEDFDRQTMQSRYFINNHVTIVIRYRDAPGRAGSRGEKVIVGFETYPKSVAADHQRNGTTGLPIDIHSASTGMELTMLRNVTVEDGQIDDLEADELEIPYTYSVYFREETNGDINWSNRWATYFVHDEDNRSVHWLAIINSLVIAGILTSVVAVIFARTIRSDIKGYAEASIEDGKLKPRKPKVSPSPRRSLEKSSGLLDGLEADECAIEDDDLLEDVTGWKLVHGDVFRTPQLGPLLAPLIGSGMQLVFMVSGLLTLSCIGVLNPSFRGGFISVGVALFVVAGLFSGYFSARVYKTFGGRQWQHNVAVTGTLVPGLLFTTVFVLNLFVWAQASSSAIPFGTLVALLMLWLLVQMPLVFVGAWVGHFRAGVYEHPVRPTLIPRQIPPQPWYLRRLQLILISGFVPYLIVLIELMFVFKSIWQDKTGFYYMFGFLSVVGLILILAVIEVTIVAVYLQLCAENYQWQWTSFFVGGSSSLWIFAYCAYYYYFKLHITGFVSSILFFSYSFMASAVYGLLTGTVGFLAAYAFVRRIYIAIKVD